LRKTQSKSLSEANGTCGSDINACGSNINQVGAGFSPHT
jgi:hypothetical protein